MKDPGRKLARQQQQKATKRPRNAAEDQEDAEQKKADEPRKDDRPPLPEGCVWVVPPKPMKELHREMADEVVWALAQFEDLTEGEEPSQATMRSGYVETRAMIQQLMDLTPPHYQLPREAQQLWRDLQREMNSLTEENKYDAMKLVDALRDWLTRHYLIPANRETVASPQPTGHINTKQRFLLSLITEKPQTWDEVWVKAKKKYEKQKKEPMPEGTVKNYLHILKDKGYIKNDGEGFYREVIIRT